ncbi:hypothetical protein TNCV_3623251 [Trichonephila clavipes]|nr:hypothetical protein TNCV_3623251 [Trichonephila clavipes]
MIWKSGKRCASNGVKIVTLTMVENDEVRHYNPRITLQCDVNRGIFIRFNLHQPIYTANLQWHQDSNPRLDEAEHELATTPPP